MTLCHFEEMCCVVSKNVIYMLNSEYILFFEVSWFIVDIC